MRILRIIEERIGGKWTDVVFHSKAVTDDYLLKNPMRLCEAINKSYKNNIVLTREFIDCPGACRSLGWLKNNNDSMVHKLAEKIGISFNIAQKVITSTPYIKQDIAAITIGDHDSPDV